MLNRLEKDLNKIINEALWSPSSDPLYENLIIAKIAYLYLKDNGLKIENENDVKEILSGANLYEEDILNE